MAAIEFVSSSLGLKLFKHSACPEDIFKDIKKGVGCFVCKDRTPGFADCEYDSDAEILQGSFLSVVPYATENYTEEGLQETHIFHTLTSANFYLSERILIATGDMNTIKILLGQLSVMSGNVVRQNEFENEEMENLINILSNIKKIGIKNSKENEIRMATISGNFETLEGYNFLGEKVWGRTIESVKGSFGFENMGVADIQINRKGHLTISGKKGMEIQIAEVVNLLDIIEDIYPDENEGEELDYPIEHPSGLSLLELSKNPNIEAQKEVLKAADGEMLDTGAKAGLW